MCTSKLASLLPSALSLAKPFFTNPFTVLKDPPMRIFPSGCTTIASTGPSTPEPASKERSRSPGAASTEHSGSKPAAFNTTERNAGSLVREQRAGARLCAAAPAAALQTAMSLRRIFHTAALQYLKTSRGFTMVGMLEVVEGSLRCSRTRPRSGHSRRSPHHETAHEHFSEGICRH